MKFLKLSLLALYAVVSAACASSPNTFEIKVTGAQHFPEGARVLVYRSKTIEAPKNIEFLKDAPFTNGVVTLTGTVENPYIIALDVVPSDSEYPFHRVTFPLEPGETVIEFTGEKYFSLKGGKYSELVVNSWNNNSDFQDVWKALLEFDGDVKIPAIREEYMTLNTRVNDLKSELLTKAYKGTNDPMAKLLLHGAGYWDKDVEQNAQSIMSLSKQLEGTREAKVALKRLLKAQEFQKARSAVQVGTVIKDFTAEDLSGQEFHLANVLKKNKYVLVEFWASWCGPCRAEIPHMKTAYKHFNKKGFEIVSFTLDSEREDWEEASEEEGIPWIDTGDLLARTSPVVKMYGVSGVPANYLVEGATGKIVAKDLRGEKLDEKLADLLP
ncbi:TlpA disulfide reductase family protein [Porticoccus sp. W117]|uniref:TlpA family protein disulfide reductase n=1 Tax=Porticoccus sp. W117 TaxID=3054777 RepID=UPI00259382DD|nr:TlpA disulfide reductase family protein [Porticoccus sp. W117]MDM3869865.1 TlpA disulfide reductase family protein [Porticoccus sp. W117]